MLIQLDVPDDVLAVVIVSRGIDGDFECDWRPISGRTDEAVRAAPLLRWVADAIEIDAL